MTNPNPEYDAKPGLSVETVARKGVTVFLSKFTRNTGMSERDTGQGIGEAAGMA